MEYDDARQQSDAVAKRELEYFHETVREGLAPYAPLVTSVRQSLGPGESSRFFTAHPTTKIELLDRYSNETIRLGHLLYVECWATSNNIKSDRAAYIEETYGRNKRAIIG